MEKILLPKLESRLTKLSLDHLNPDDQRQIYILRDDELGGFWGTKFRKYASINAHCLAQNIPNIIATGGINSNNLAAAATLCAEKGLKVSAFAVDDHSENPNLQTGNRFLLRLAISPENLHLIQREDKPQISTLMRELADKFDAKGQNSLILEDGGGCLPAVTGCLTLADDIVRDRQEWPKGTFPDHIFMDSGTGLSVASLAAGLLKKDLLKKTRIHIVQMAGFEEQVLQAFSNWVTPVTGVSWNDVAERVRVYRPLSPRSYGATSEELFTFIRKMARNHGILLDPIYSGKLFMRAFDLIHGQNCRGNILIVHTGGISGMMGFPRIIEDLAPPSR